ncbi:hypothetical protein CW362_35255 [Streptomyces populi]|uniref:Uncharacterized protein n=1 Tax=Streptomyces populi TaxID=2058924 RepID=A0A2I0SEL7_9ACTN|nr:hypothetical protein CW362_35255 [Streptomyces populi]
MSQHFSRMVPPLVLQDLSGGFASSFAFQAVLAELVYDPPRRDRTVGGHARKQVGRAAVLWRPEQGADRRSCDLSLDE